MIFYVAQTYINPLGLALTLLVGVLLLIVPKRYAMVPIILLICDMNLGTNIVVAGLNFTMLRLLLVFGWARLVIRQEVHGLKLNEIDKAVILFIVSSIITYTLLWQSYDAFKNKLGLAYNVLGFFFFFRYLIRDLKDVIRTIKICATLLVPLACCMLLEKFSGHNVFAYFGGVSAISPVRDGVVRCQGPFAHPILAGSFGATLIPLFLGLWMQRKRPLRILAVIGLVGATIVIFCAASSGPVMAGLAGVLGFILWPLRRRMRMLRWAIIIGLIIVQLNMKPPVWFLMAKIDIFNGNTGWHRAHLIDIAYRNLSDWWLVGTRSNANWDVNYDHNYDITNQYIDYGIEGGLITLSLFIWIIVSCFRGVGKAVRALRDEPRVQQMLAWSLGAALFAHAVNYLSISYFDQNIISWYMLVAMISAISSHALRIRRSSAKLKAPSPESSFQERSITA